MGLWSFAVFLILFNIANTFGPPPPADIVALSFTLIVLMAIIIAIAFWIDKKRVITGGARTYLKQANPGL